jgi:hemoglobin
MSKIKPILTALCLCVTVAATAAAQEKSLYDRLGGKDAINVVVEDFVGRVAADTRIDQKFGKSNIPRVKAELVDQICMATGGPCKYTGRDMKTAHKNMKVTEGEFGALVEDLVASLDHFNVPEKEKGELLAILGPLKAQIVEVKGDATGTPLPSNFKPAPPLKPKM